MKKRLINTVAFLLSVMFLFSGCSLLDFFSAENLLKAPRLTGENAALQEAFENVAGKEVSLFAPVTGEYRASYILFDIDNDKTDEAIVFYAVNSNISVIHMNILKKQEEQWNSVADIAGSGTSVYKVDFFNIDAESTLEIAVTWMVEDSKKEKTLSLYRFSAESSAENASITSVATIQLVDYIFLDIDNDSINELVYMFFDTSAENGGNMGIRLLDYDVSDKKLLPVSNLNLNCQISSLVQIVSSKSGDAHNIYIDALGFDGKLFTEVIVFDSEKSVLSVSVLDGSPMSVFTQRNSLLTCCDFDNDGQYDIPFEIDYEDSYVTGEEDSGAGQIRFISWNNYRDGVLYEKGKYFLNIFDGYSMKIDDFYDNCYIVYDYGTRETQIRSRSDEDNNLVFSVKIRTEDTENKHISDSASPYLISISPLGESMDITKMYINDLISDKGWFY